MTRRVLPWLGALAAVAAVACTSGERSVPVPPPGPPAATPAPVPISFPTDEGPHDNRLEWWYYSGHLQDDSGAEFGFHFVVFQSRDQSVPGGNGGPAYAAQFGFTDVRAGDHVEGARFATGEQPQPGPGLSGLRVGDWTLSANPDAHAIEAGTGDTTLSLAMTPAGPPALHDEIGWLPGPVSGWTYYYSRPRMAASGVLTVGDRQIPVRGDVWMDHQWGEFFVLGNPAGWQWFGIQLDDGANLMITQARDADGAVSALYGSLIGADGSLTPLRGGPGDIELVTGGTWQSPHTGAIYPSEWTVRLPGQGLELRLTPVVADQEIASTRPESAIYWEGKVSVTGTRDGTSIGGNGYVELTGYVVPPRLPWRDADAAAVP